MDVGVVGCQKSAIRVVDKNLQALLFYTDALFVQVATLRRLSFIMDRFTSHWAGRVGIPWY